MRNTARQTRVNRTITVDFHDEATYLKLLDDLRAFVEFVLAFLLALGFHLKHKATCRPSSTEAATRPNKEHRDVREFPFSYLALAICAENGRNEGCDMFTSREKVPVLVDRGNSHSDESRR